MWNVFFEIQALLSSLLSNVNNILCVCVCVCQSSRPKKGINLRNKQSILLFFEVIDFENYA